MTCWLLDIEGEFTPEELERLMNDNNEELLALEELGLEVAIAASPLSPESNASTGKKMQEMDMMDMASNLSGKSDLVAKRGSDEAKDDATSNLRGTSNKKKRLE